MKQKLIVATIGMLALLTLLYGAGRNTNGGGTIQSTVNFCADAGSTDAYACNMAPALGAYVSGACYTFKANTANTGAATIAFNGLAAKTIVKVAGGITTALADNDIRAGQYVNICYDGTNMQMQSTLGNGASASVTCSTGITSGFGCLVEQHAASASNSLDFTTCITSTYDDYQIDAISLVTETNAAEIQFLVSTDGGMTYQTTNYLTNLIAIPVAGGSNVSVTSTTAMWFTNNFGTGATRATYSGSIRMFNPGDSTLNKVFTMAGTGPNSTSPAYFSYIGGGIWNSASAVNAFRVIASTGKLQTGAVRCYGVAKA